MPQYKVSYFDIMGLGEPIRFILSYGGVDFQDNRVERADWLKLKPSMPFGQLPVLEIDGKKYAQSLSICRYLAKKFNINGKTELDALEIDSVTEAISDFRKSLALFFREADPAQQAKKKEVALRDTVPYYLNKFEEIVKANGGYFHGGELSYADLFFVSLIEHMSHIAEFHITKNHPNLKALEEKVKAIPSIKAWIEKRPKSDF